MERSLFKIIRNQADYPNISILLPTSKHFPDTGQDARILNKLAEAARQRLFAEFDKKQIRQLLYRLGRAVSSVDLTQSLDGLAIYVNSRFEMTVHLPFPVKERLIIDTFFSTRDLIRAINRGINYYILFVSDNFVRLFEANRDTLSEINEAGFPFVNPRGRNTDSETSVSAKEIRRREFASIVNRSFSRIYIQHPMKLIVAGTAADISLYREADWGNVLFAALEEVHDNTLPNELAQKIWPLIKSSMKEKRIKVIENLEEAGGQKRLVTGIEDVWKSAFLARGELLVIEEDYRPQTMVNRDSNNITMSAGQGVQITLDDAIDEIAERVVSTGGKVVFTENGSLHGYNHIALVLKQA
jgi:hypothetical protein